MAPLTTINFDTMGYMRVCCYNSEFILGTYPTTSLKDAWYNSKRERFAGALKKLTFPKGCEKCKQQIIEGNAQNSLFSSFDWLDSQMDENYPVSLAFDFGSVCNYECIMCGGKWSSSIRKNREKLPALKSPYDDNFVEQLKFFIPHLKSVSFLGGEPFLNGIYYKIWDAILELNPDVQMYITTNGSIYNSRIENYLNKFRNCNVIISLDSLEEQTYSFIRKNGNLKTVLENFAKFKSLNKMSGIAFCPMIQNVLELPKIIQFCIDHKLALFINDVTNHLGGKLKGIHEGEFENTNVWIGGEDTIVNQVIAKNDVLIPEVALHTLPKKQLIKIENILSKFSFENHAIFNKKYKGFLSSLRHIIQNKPGTIQMIKSTFNDALKEKTFQGKCYVIKKIFKELL